MQDLIKKIRSHMNMNQTEFAELLNVTFATVNRWENGRALPNKLAQDKIYNLCKEYDVPVYDMVLEKIEAASGSIELEKGRVLLYHGSKSGIKGDIAPLSRKQCDFGEGFYMGTEPSQALTLICDYESAKFYVVSISVDNLAVLDVPADLEWAMIVAYHRGRMEKTKGTPFYSKYQEMTKDKDLVIGSIANDRMFFVIDNFFIGNITDAALINSLSALELGKQYVAVTQKGCDAVRIEKEIPISYLEKLFMKEVSEANRVKGSSLANDICRNYRREGLFFDEILDQAAGGQIMNEIQLKLCDIQGRLFELSVDRQLGSAGFIKTFMNSETAKALDSTYNRMQWAGEEYLLEEVIEAAEDKLSEKGEVCSKDVIYWIGYIYRYWHYYTEESSKAIYKQAPVETMKRNYLMFHTMAPEVAIENLKEIYRQK